MGGFSAPPDQVQRDEAILARIKVEMPRLGAEMRQVDPGHRVGRPDAKHGSGGQSQQALARPQHGEGAEKPLAIQRLVPIHPSHLAGDARADKVSDPKRGCDALSG